MSESKCSSCEAMDASDCLSAATIALKLEVHPLWALNSLGHLSRHFEATNFQAALEFINLVGATAERHGHHPDIHLTNYRQVEIVLFTHSVAGVTVEDFKLAEAIDTIPVMYSMNWKKKHPDLAALTPSAAPAASASNRGKEAHASHEASLTDPKNYNNSGVHMTSMSDDGSHLHQHEFKVHTAHTVLLGHGETRHPHTTAAETSTAEQIPASRRIPRDTWVKMAGALSTLKSTGFDVGEAENYLPMFEMHAIHPSMEGDIFRFYKHLLHRLEPDVRSTEPVSVVEAALGFVEGYEELKGIGPYFSG